MISQHFHNQKLSFSEKHKRKLIDNPQSIHRLRDVCELIKIELSDTTNGSVNLSGLFDGIVFVTSIIRQKFEKLCGKNFKEMNAFKWPCRKQKQKLVLPITFF